MLFGEGPQIKNIAADINKLFRQGSLLNQIGQTIEGDSTADQGTSDLLAARDPVIQEISVGMSGEQSARYTVSGTPPLSLTNSLGKPLKAWEVDLLPYQEGTGDPSPDNVRPIHGTDKVTITTAGSNLFDKNATDTSNGYGNNIYIRVNGSDAITTNYNSSEYIEILPSTDYVLSPTTGSNPSLCFYTASKVYISGIEYNSASSVTFTTPNNAKYLRCSIPKVNVDTFQLNVGSTALPYTPYLAPSQTVLTLPQTVYTGTIGSDGGESRNAEVDLGTLDWSLRTYSDKQFFTALVPNAKVYGTYDVPNWYCEAYKPVSARDFTSAMNTGYITHGVTGFYVDYVCICNTDYSTGEELKASLQGVKLVYELATPTTFSVPSPTIPTPTGTATTWATAEDGTVDSMEVTYVGKA